MYMPCIPQNVSSHIKCEDNCLTVSWLESEGADTYLTTVQGSNGLSTTCQAMSETSCNVTGLSCGQIYHASVISSDGYCDSPHSAVVDTPSAPCQASRIDAILDCHLQKITVSWYPSDGAVMYEATASTASGQSLKCDTADTNCEVGGLLCGQSYSISVRAKGQTCHSIAHMTRQVATGPCIPQHISTHYSLSIGQVLWDVSMGAVSYNVEAVTDQGLRRTCVTTDTYCPITNLLCSQTYKVSVTAINGVCENSKSTEGVSIKTEPCPPINVEASVRCDNKRATITWEPSIDAVAYVAYLSGYDGHSLSCYSSTTFCDVDELHCGVTYNTRVIAVGQEFNSTSSSIFLLNSAPCAAANLVAEFDCNTAQISWSPAIGVTSYKVTATGSDGHQAFCQSANLPNCSMTELECGQLYNVSLTAFNSNCQTDTSTDVSFRSRPCKPLRVGVDLECGTSTANLYWEEREGVELYVATATYGMETMQCNSTESTCKFPDLKCGKTYHFSVTAHSHGCNSDISSTVEIQTVKAQDSRCDSPVSEPAEFRTGPCVPQHVESNTHCEDHLGRVSWAPADGAESYMAVAVGQDGHSHECVSETNMCAWDDLHCGEQYTVHVIANYYMCSSQPSNSTKIRMAPCGPQNVTASMNCSLKAAYLTWSASEAADAYIVTAQTNGGHKVELSTSETSTFIAGLMCGQEYFLSVQATDSVCKSVSSVTEVLKSAPCPPIGVASSLDCISNIVAISWTASAGAEFYTAKVIGEGGDEYDCMSQGTACGMANLACGQNYTINVIASAVLAGSQCDSYPSEPDSLRSGEN
ncbi:fibronectin type III domain-containing protein 7-like [Genypterus blacodes]|uniref:fibronectin type III domain-containing protein 7-like n=1 Tax=Genypterus blacodes TaxID=154954 RepID=UPI003F75B35E